MSTIRHAAARNALLSEEAKKVFDKLREVYPSASVFWDDDGQFAELQMKGAVVIISSGGDPL